MKSKVTTILFASVMGLVNTSNAASTVSIKNFTSASVGIPVVNASGAAVALNSINASAGTFATVPDFTSATAAQVLAAFSRADASPIGSPTFTGLFTGNDLNNVAYPSGFSGAPAYVLVSNTAGTEIAVYSTGLVFTPVDGAGNSNIALNATVANNWVYGITRSVTTQPSLSGAAFTNGVILSSVAIPEPSAAVLGALGALGLLRRRRN